jgi:hypothetical protein
MPISPATTRCCATWRRQDSSRPTTRAQLAQIFSDLRNRFDPSANTSVFAKLHVTFGDNVDGVGGKAGMPVSW